MTDVLILMAFESLARKNWLDKILGFGAEGELLVGDSSLFYAKIPLAQRVPKHENFQRA